MLAGIYLVIDPSMETVALLRQLKQVANREIAAIEIWDHFDGSQDRLQLIRQIYELCNEHHVPLLINNHWEFLKTVALDGVHFDLPPTDLLRIKREIGRDFIVGLTCGNDLDSVRWAEENDVDYISFCSMFPSKSDVECEIVNFETVRKARQIFNRRLFLSGGIYPENIDQLNGLPYDGIAVISGIMSSEAPSRAMDRYIDKLKVKLEL